MTIKELRGKTGKTQGTLAYELGVSRAAVAMWESGKAIPTADKLPAIAAALGCTIDDLFGTGGTA